MLDVERELVGAQPAQCTLQRCDVELGFAAELLIDHPWIGAGLLDNASDAAAGIAMGRKLGRGGAQDLGAGLLGRAARASARFVGGLGERWADSHVAALLAARSAQRLVGSSSARS